jgi:prophage maintenance system killer protein
LVKNKALGESNKRAARLLTRSFLFIKGLEPHLNDDEACGLVVKIAKGSSRDHWGSRSSFCG